MPASFEGQRNLVHYALMLCVAGILVGIAVGMNRILIGAFFGLSAIMFMLSWDLILYDTNKKYDEKKSQRITQTENNDADIERSVQSQWLDTRFAILILTVLMFLVIFVAEYKNIVVQIDEWWTLLIEN